MPVRGDGHGKAAKARHQSAEALDPRTLGWQARPRQHEYHLDRVRRTFREVDDCRPKHRQIAP